MQLLCVSVPLVWNEDSHAVLQLIGGAGSFVMGKCVRVGIPETQDIIVGVTKDFHVSLDETIISLG